MLPASHSPYRLLEQEQNGGPETLLALMIDGNRDGDYVLFDHEKHVSKQGGGDDSCVLCHHMQKPYEEVSECTGCHSDMYLAVDIFDHDTHVERTKGNEGCIECHTDPAADKLRETTKACRECHETMRPEGTRVDIVEAQQTTMAPGYMDAMHGACISCHEEEMATREETNGDARCRPHPLHQLPPGSAAARGRAVEGAAMSRIHRSSGIRDGPRSRAVARFVREGPSVVDQAAKSSRPRSAPGSAGSCSSTFRTTSR